MDKNKDMPTFAPNTKPGDRGDSTSTAGINGIKSGNSGTLSGYVSKGYEAVKTGWNGNVRR